MRRLIKTIVYVVLLALVLAIGAFVGMYAAGAVRVDTQTGKVTLENEGHPPQVPAASVQH